MSTSPVLEGVVVDAPRAVKIFGREPAVLLGLVGSGVALFVALFGARFGLDGDFTAVAMAVVSAGLGFYSAWATKDALLGVSVGLVKAVISLGLYFGLDMSVELQASVMLFVEALVGFWQRTQTSPVSAPIDPSPTQIVASPVTVDDLDQAEDPDVQARVDSEVAAYRASSADTKHAATYHGTGHVDPSAGISRHPDDPGC